MSKYYDADDILAEEETLPTVFNTSVYGLGRALDPSCDSEDLPVGSSVNLPFWLANFLSQRKMLKPQMPKSRRAIGWTAIAPDPAQSHR